MNQSKIVIYQTQDGKTSIDVKLEQDTVWLTANQMSLLFDKDEKTIRKHINNIFKEGEVDKDNNTQKMRVVGVKQNVAVYTLDVIISVGYRVNSKRATFFRRWATNILKEYLIRGIAINDNRLKQLGKTIRILKRSTDQLDAKQVLAVVEQYTMALDLLDDYDHQCIGKPEGNKATYILSYEECRKVINDMKFNTHNDLFGNEKDDSFHSSIGAIYQTFGGEDVYPSVEEKAANLLYFVTKNHSFSDGNKRIAATIFLYFLQKNGILYRDNREKRIDDSTLVAVTIMIAESRIEEKELMTRLVMNFLV
ncbi:virulence protein RhuM/Fic/DOC family protein [Bacteroides fluxus]|uniref:virulence protein RhuM/Fic/DOC family protein n=1 Tax=Bacteroides fluxus TaxID=626930 RepID=UPI002A7F045C|nr:virulence protein RhuM/Fic/DOC family protein [Bacteroides fluxus]MDY3789798.1 virulence protein RhuM/Fic/DOC family protein [Bacteroides fluxus]